MLSHYQVDFDVLSDESASISRTIRIMNLKRIYVWLSRDAVTLDESSIDAGTSTTGINQGMSVNLFPDRVLHKLQGDEALQLSPPTCPYELGIIRQVFFALRNRKIFYFIALSQRI